MKIRSGFVSNSSSSSFIIISYHEMKIPNLNGEPLVIPDTFGGNTEFGWEFKKYNDIGSKINFCTMQALSNVESEWLGMLYTVLKDSLNCQDVTVKHDFGYIDHQSMWYEDDYVNEIFEYEKSLKQFLFCSESFVRTGTDNV